LWGLQIKLLLALFMAPTGGKFTSKASLPCAANFFPPSNHADPMQYAAGQHGKCDSHCSARFDVLAIAGHDTASPSPRLTSGGCCRVPPFPNYAECRGGPVPGPYATGTAAKRNQ